MNAVEPPDGRQTTRPSSSKHKAPSSNGLRTPEVLLPLLDMLDEMLKRSEKENTRQRSSSWWSRWTRVVTFILMTNPVKG